MMVPNSRQPHAGNAQVRLNERKIVKTISLKKVAVVAVASLGFGLTSVVPANAATTLSGKVVATNSSTAVNKATVEALTASTAIAPASFTAVGGSTVRVTADMDTYAAVTGTIGTNADFTTGQAALTIASTAALETTEAQVTFVAPTVAGTYYVLLASTTGNAWLKLTVVNAGAKLGDGFNATAGTATAASATQTTLNAIAGVANTATIYVTRSATLGGIVTVSGAGSAIKSVSANGTIAANFLSAEIASGGASANDVVISTPTAGTITANYYAETSAGSGIYGATPSSTVTITVNAAAVAGGINTATSTAVMNAAATWSSTTEAAVSASSTASATPVAAIKVTLAQTAGAITTTTAVTTSITGSGSLYLNDNNDHTTSAIGAGRSLSSTIATTGETFYVMVAPDGNSGVGTVTIKAGTYTVTKSVTFYGAATKYTATTNIVAAANGTTSTDVVTVCAVDAAGIAVPGETIYGFSGDTTVATIEASDATEATAIVTSGTSMADHVAATAVGCVGFSISGLTQTTKSSVVLTFGNASTIATSTVTATATALVGEVAATKTTLTANKTTYNVGEAITLTLTYTDSVGRPVAYGPGTANLAAALTASSALSTAALFATANISKLGTTVQTVNAPLAAGPVTVTGKTGAAGTYVATAGAGAALSVTFTVIDANQSALLTQIDALNAKIVALNALIAKIMKKLGVK